MIWCIWRENVNGWGIKKEKFGAMRNRGGPRSFRPFGGTARLSTSSGLDGAAKTLASGSGSLGPRQYAGRLLREIQELPAVSAREPVPPIGKRIS